MRRSKKQFLYWTLLAILALFVLGELFLRWRYGLGDAVLMRADDDYEYIAQPNQRRKRFGNRVVYNSHSMRNEELIPGSARILCIGDSILNGGTLTDQSELATSILSKELSAETGKQVQVLNVSAGSWGPDNCLAYLKRHGHFGAKGIILVVSSHDAHDTMTFVPVVGQHRSYPSRQYPLAIMELWDRYLFPGKPFFKQSKASVDNEFRRIHHIEKTEVTFNPGFQGILDYARDFRLSFAIYLHATLYEMNAGNYDADGQAVIEFCKRNQIPWVQDLGNGLDRECILQNDYLHYSPKGQALMGRLLKPRCQTMLSHDKDLNP